MTIINTFFYASLAYSICLYLIPTHGSLLVVTIVSTCLTLGFRFFGLRVMTPFIAICLFFTRHIHCKDSRCLSSMIAYLCRSGPSFAGRSEFLGNIFVHTRFHGGIPGMSCRGQEGFIAQDTLLWVPTILLAKWTFVLVVFLLQFVVYYTIRIFEIYFS